MDAGVAVVYLVILALIAAAFVADDLARAE
jgi:hypothetical protein